MSEPLTLPAPQLLSSTTPRSKWEKEYGAFLRLLPTLLQTHRDQFVAIHEEQVVDSGPDELALALRVLKRFNNVPVHIGLVTDQPIPPARIPNYRILSSDSRP